MSQENVEIVRAAIDGYNRRDWDAVIKDAAPDFEFDMSRARGPQSGTYRLNQMHDFFDEFADMFESTQAEAEGFIEVDDKVIVPITLRARGRGGIEVTARPAWLVALHEGAIRSMAMHQSKADALEAAGLQE